MHQIPVFEIRPKPDSLMLVLVAVCYDAVIIKTFNVFIQSLFECKLSQ